MSPLEQQFFPNSDRTEIFVDITLPQGASLEATERSVNTLEQWLKQQPKAQIVSSRIFSRFASACSRLTRMDGLFEGSG